MFVMKNFSFIQLSMLLLLFLTCPIWWWISIEKKIFHHRSCRMMFGVCFSSLNIARQFHPRSHTSLLSVSSKCAKNLFSLAFRPKRFRVGLIFPPFSQLGFHVSLKCSCKSLLHPNEALQHTQHSWRHSHSFRLSQFARERFCSPSPFLLFLDSPTRVNAKGEKVLLIFCWKISLGENFMAPIVDVTTSTTTIHCVILVGNAKHRRHRYRERWISYPN